MLFKTPFFNGRFYYRFYCWFEIEIDNFIGGCLSIHRSNFVPCVKFAEKKFSNKINELTRASEILPHPEMIPQKACLHCFSEQNIN
jgi:hypothetical protein